jgi:hypothetical protein
MRNGQRRFEGGSHQGVFLGRITAQRP